VCVVDPFTIITREAGAGAISLGVEGPSKAVIDYQDRRDGTSDVNYVVTEPGACASRDACACHVTMLRIT